MRLLFLLLFILPLQASTIVESARKVRPLQIVTEVVASEDDFDVDAFLAEIDQELEQLTQPLPKIPLDQIPVIRLSHEVASVKERDEQMRLMEAYFESATRRDLEVLHTYYKDSKYNSIQRALILGTLAWLKDSDVVSYMMYIERNKQVLAPHLKTMNLEFSFDCHVITYIYDI